MFFKNHFGMIVSVVISIFMGVVMAVSAMIVDSLDKTVWVFINSWGTITWIVLLCLILIPLPMWGNKMAQACKCKPQTLPFRLVSSIIPAVVIDTANTLVMAAINIFGNAAIPAEAQMGIWTSAILRDWPIMLLISYIASIFGGLLGEAIAKRSVCP